MLTKNGQKMVILNQNCHCSLKIAKNIMFNHSHGPLSRFTKIVWNTHSIVFKIVKKCSFLHASSWIHNPNICSNWPLFRGLWPLFLFTCHSYSHKGLPPFSHQNGQKMVRGDHKNGQFVVNRKFYLEYLMYIFGKQKIKVRDIFD